MVKSPAKKSPDEIKKDLKKLCDSARKEPQFGLCLPKDSNGIPCILDSRSKDAKSLEVRAKKECGGQKVARGTLSFKSGKLFFHLENDPPSGLLKALKSHFGTYSSVKPILVMSDGKLDGEDDDAPDKANDQKERAAYVKSLTDIVTRLQSAMARDKALDARVDKITGAMQKIQEASNFDKKAAATVVARLEDVESQVMLVEDLRAKFAQLEPSLSKTAKQSAGAAKQIAGLSQKFNDASGANPPDAKTMKVILQAAEKLSQAAPKGSETKEKAASDPKTDASLQKLNEIFLTATTRLEEIAEVDPRLAPALQKIRSSYEKITARSPVDVKSLEKLTSSAQRLIPKTGPANDPGKKEFDNALALWSTAAADARKDLAALSAAIGAECKGLPIVSDVDAAFKKLDGKIDQLEKSLGNLIGNAAKNDDAAKRTQQATKVIETAIDVGKMLKDDKILSQIDDNPFQKVSVAAALKLSLIEVRKRLAA